MRALTNLELYYVVQELSRLEGGRIDAVYGLGNGRFRIKLRGKGNLDLAVDLGTKLAYITKRIEKSPETPDSFTMELRKLLENARVEKVRQYDFDRIIVFDLARESKMFLILELFSNGNLIVCDEEMKVWRAYRQEQWKDRSIRHGQVYGFPKSQHLEPFEITAEQIENVLGDKHIISTLARAVPIGTQYLEEALARARIEPTKKGSSLSEQERRGLARELKIAGSRFEPVLVEGDPADFSLFPLEKFAGLKMKHFPTLSECLDAHMAASPMRAAVDEKLAEERNALGKSLELQKQALARLEAEEAESRKAAEAIYSNYGRVEEALKETKGLAAGKTPADKMMGLVGKKGVKKVDASKGELELEL